MEEKKILPKKKKRSFVKSFLVFLVLILGGTIAFLYGQYSDAKKEIIKLEDPKYISEFQESQAKETLANLGAVMLLPDENPTIATIVDADSLRTENELFYKDAQNEDKLIVFSDKAILFREAGGLIVNIAPIFATPETEKNEEEINDEAVEVNDETAEEDATDETTDENVEEEPQTDTSE